MYVREYHVYSVRYYPTFHVAAVGITGELRGGTAVYVNVCQPHKEHRN
jgi:hypothetical protein